MFDKCLPRPSKLPIAHEYLEARVTTDICTVFPKTHAHVSRLFVFCCGQISVDLSIFCRVVSLAAGQSYDCQVPSEAILEIWVSTGASEVTTKTQGSAKMQQMERIMFQHHRAPSQYKDRLSQVWGLPC